MKIPIVRFVEWCVLTPLGSQEFVRLFRMVKPPRWGTPVLIALGTLSSFAEALGITLILLFFYAMMGRLDLAVSDNMLLSRVLRIGSTYLGNPYEIASVLFLLITLRGGLAYSYSMVGAHIGEVISQFTRDQIHRQYLQVSYRDLRRYEQSELMQVLGTESWLLSTVHDKVTRSIVSITSIAIMGTLLVLLSAKLAFCVLFGSAGISLALRYLSHVAKKRGEEMRQVHLRLGRQMSTTLYGMRVIRAFGQERFHEQRFTALSATARLSAIRATRLLAMLGPLTEIGYLAILGAIMMLSRYLGIDFATTLAFVALLYRIQPLVSQLEQSRLFIAQSQSQLRSVRRMMEFTVDRRTPLGSVPINAFEGPISFKNVVLQYDEGPSALNDASFEIPLGKTTALVGVSGSGKTSIVNLLLRLYEPDSGRITANDRALADLSRDDWLGLVAVAGQDVDLIEGTVFDNVSMARPDATREQVQYALTLAGIDAMTDGLPEGLDTWIGHQGMRFSGGQRQRLGLARALLHNPALLILDEATNAIDPGMEERIRDAIRDRFSDRTILLITHRLEAAADADHLVWIDNGRIVKEGPPDRILSETTELSARSTKYLGPT